MYRRHPGSQFWSKTPLEIADLAGPESGQFGAKINRKCFEIAIYHVDSKFARIFRKILKMKLCYVICRFLESAIFIEFLTKRQALLNRRFPRALHKISKHFPFIFAPSWPLSGPAKSAISSGVFLQNREPGCRFYKEILFSPILSNLDFHHMHMQTVSGRLNNFC